LPADLTIRQSAPSDTEPILDIYGQTFPDEELRPLVNELLTLGADYFSLLAIRDNNIVGHIGLTLCSVDQTTAKVGLLAPLAVAPSWQRDGVGRKLVEAVCEQAKRLGCHAILVLGDPAYYCRFGFKQEDMVKPPYPLPADWCGAWQSTIIRSTDEQLSGNLSVPGPWRNPSLWAPQD